MDSLTIFQYQSSIIPRRAEMRHHIASMVVGLAHIVTGILAILSLGYFVKYPPIEVAEFFAKHGWLKGQK